MDHSSGKKRWRGGGRDRGGGSKRGRGGGGSGGSNGGWMYPPSKDGNYSAEQMSNKLFDEYYKAQAIIPSEEWEAFMSTMRKALPVTFRINPLAHNAAEIRRRLLGDESSDSIGRTDETIAQTYVQSSSSSQVSSYSNSSSVSINGSSTFSDGPIDNIDLSKNNETNKTALSFNSAAPSGPSKAASVMSLFSTPIQMDDGSVIAPPQALSWKSDAYQLSYGKSDLRKNAKLKSFHEWLQLVSDEGSITRQEAVSMIPPLLLDVKPHHVVLDMCAAPGSKTGQLIEMLHLGELAQKGSSGSATGLVIANDSDTKRAYLLCSQCNRLGSPALVVTCHDAQLFPNLNKSSTSSSSSSSDGVLGDVTTAAANNTQKEEGGNHHVERTSSRIKGQGVPGCFDRVLCDVPCSGDGTARKNADMFIRWSPAGGLALHPLQIQICMRGLALVKVGGLLVYSTCSLNPIEDEAVVSEVLRRCEGSVELVDPSNAVPGLKFSPGVSTWKVYDKDMQLFSSWDEVQAPNAHGHPHKNARKMNKSNFPPPPDVAASYNLRYCMRLLPHHQDTGGFFVALLRKVAPLSTAKPWYAPSTENPSKEAATNEDVDTEDELELSRAKPFYGRVGPPPPTHVNLLPLGTRIPPTVEVDAHANVAEDGLDASHVDESIEDEASDDEKDTNINDDSTKVEEDALKSTNDAVPHQVSPPIESASSMKTSSWMPPKSNASVPSGRGGSAAGAMNERDSKGRKLSGRFELSTYEKCDGLVVSDLIKDFGLGREYMRFPASQLFTRSETSKNIVIVSDLISRLVIPQQKLGNGDGRVKTVNTGLKAFAENKSSDKYKTPPSTYQDATLDGNSGSVVDGIPRPLGYVPPTDFRLLQEGLSLVLPFMSRQIVYASGKEAAHILKYRGQFVAEDVFPARLRRWLAAIDIGSFALVCHPALDGFEDYEGGLLPEASGVQHTLDFSSTNINAQPFSGMTTSVVSANRVREDDALRSTLTCSPKRIVAKEHASLIAPALACHYETQDDGSLEYKPSLRVFSGSGPLARLAMCCWKGKAKYNLMVQTVEAAALVQSLCTAGYSAE